MSSWLDIANSLIDEIIGEFDEDEWQDRAEEAGQWLARGYDDYTAALLAGTDIMRPLADNWLRESTAMLQSGTDAYDAALRDVYTGLEDIHADQAARYDNALQDADAGFRRDLDAATAAHDRVLNRAGRRHGDALSRTYRDSARHRTAGLDAYRTAVRRGLAGHEAALDQGLAGATDALRRGQMASEAAWGPTRRVGTEALAGLRGIARQQPGRLTPSQRRELDAYHRDARATLAASGLRGAGRAGIAAVNEGAAALRAGFHDTNRARIDRAMETLAQYGHGANADVAASRQRTGQVLGDTRWQAAQRRGEARRAGAEAMGRAHLDTRAALADSRERLGQDVAANRLALANNRASLGWEAAQLTAANRARSREEAARARRDARRSAAEHMASAETAIADNRLATSQQFANTLATYYDRMMNLADRDARARADGALGRAKGRAEGLTAGADG